ncbi:hypothetical protein PXD56_01400 [Maribacter sp. SA7]|uniref:hypothetical protein n=1 Tax=Maribacter zhoushanensis TaxID=3030012 RepID=UPI0023EDACC8|nr:hypothetical protein [Maribacter zhoushanensis]MDF4201590.1 hypothetical protein [Maribacter zhoushanensis]
MKKIFELAIILLTIGCASHKKTNKLTAKIQCDKNFYFAYDDRSDFEKFKYEGQPVIGNSNSPDIKQTFIKSIRVLNNETEMSLNFIDSNMLPSNSEIFARVRIEDIRLIAGISSGVLEVDLLYQMDGKKIYLTGKNKVHVGFNKKGILFKVIKNGHYLFISSMCSP